MEISLNGNAFKYTNFFFGFQERYFKLNSGVIYYYLSKETEKEGCRKFRVLSNFKLEFDDDPYRFDIVFSDEKWSLRFCSRDELVLWRDALQAFSKYPLEIVEEMRLMSTSSNSTQSSSLFGQECDVQDQLPSCSNVDSNSLHKLREEMPSQLNTVIKVLDQCLKCEKTDSFFSMADVETAIQKCGVLVKNLEQTKCLLKTFSAKMKQGSMENVAASSSLPKNHMVTDEDVDEQWEDAVEDNGNKTEEHQVVNSTQFSAPAKVLQPIDNTNSSSPDALKPTQPDNCLPKASSTAHEPPIFAEIHSISKEQLRHALTGVEQGEWELFVSDGPMRMYKMEQEVVGPDGKKVVVDPLKAVHSVKGVSAREYIDLFFNPDLKSEWDDTLVSIKIIERLSEDTVILHQLHRRIWPSAQRESLFWSQKSNVSAHKDADALDAFMVCSHDLERQDVPLTKPSCVRVKLTIAMVCQTVVDGKAKHLPLDQLNREHVLCKITYVAQVHPGGWVPSFSLRQIYKTEYPKFLKSFTEYVVNKLKEQPLQL